MLASPSYTLTKQNPGEMKQYEPAEPGWVRIEMDVPARGLIGYMAGEFKNDVHGEGYVNSTFNLCSVFLKDDC